jgi:hypothetical protein
MKLTSIEIHIKNSTDIMVLSFRDPTRRNAFNIKDITGLDAENILAQPHAGTSQTEKYYTLYAQKRDIVFKIGLNPRQGEGESHSDLRDAIYKAVSSSRASEVEIHFKNGTELVATLSGFISKIEAPHFTKTQEVTLTVSCKNPMLKSPYPVQIDVKDLNPSYTIIYDARSTSPHGLTYSVSLFSDLPEMVFGSPEGDWHFGLAPTAVGGFQRSDILHVSSEDPKEVYLNRGANKLYIADAITPGSSWPIVFPGHNVFKFETTLIVWEAISYHQTYWGV